MTEAAPGADAREPAMTPGARLAQARIARGLSLEAVAQQLKFAPRQIDALEGDRYDELPGVAVVRGMVRGYARLVEVDAAPLLEALRDAVPAPDASRIVARYREPVPFSDPSKRSNLAYVVFTLAALAVAALVLVQWRQERPAPETRMTFVAPAAEPQTTVASAGSRLPVGPALEPAAAEPDAQPASDGAASATADTPDAAAAEPAQAAGAEPAAGAAATQTAAAAGVAETAVQSRGAPPADGAQRVQLEFLGEAWVEVRDGKGKLLHAQLNAAGSEVRLEGKPPLSFVIGNAQFVRLSVDGRSVDLTPHIRVAVARFKLP